MISTIIFSKDRANQLNLLLESIDENGSNLFDSTVIYTATDDSFQEGYDKLLDAYSDINFIKQNDAPSDFREITLEAINNCGEYVCFFVDDNIIYRKIDVDFNSICKLFEHDDNVVCLSLRLGVNTLIQNEYKGVYSPVPQKVEVFEDTYILWDWTALPSHTNFAYPFSVDGHIFKTKTVSDMIDYDFDTPNGFEGRGKADSLPPVMSCFSESIVVNSPINIVGSSANAAGIKYGMSLEKLNEMFLEGQSIDLKSMDFSNVRRCHQEIQYQFKGEVKC